MAVMEGRDTMYKLIISQLRADGYEDAAQIVADRTTGGKLSAPTARLAHVAELGTQSEARQHALDEERQSETSGSKSTNGGTNGTTAHGDLVFGANPMKLDLDAGEAVLSPASPLTPTHIYTSNHRATVYATCFSADGKLAASADTAALVRIYNVDKVVKSRDVSGGDSSGVARTIADHLEPINDMAFHPNNENFVSASDDASIRIYDFQKPSIRGPLRTIQDSHKVNSIAMHPSGQYILAGTDHPIIRLHNATTSHCFAVQNPLEHHTAPVTQVRYNSTGRYFASACKAGKIKIWDGLSCRCIQTINKAHDGTAVTSVQFSKNDNYLLSGGRDSVVRLWDLRTHRVLVSYVGAATTKSPRAQCCFSHDERRVFCADEDSRGLVSWDAGTGDFFSIKKDLKIGEWFSHSPAHSILLAGSHGLDKQARVYLLEDPSAMAGTSNADTGAEVAAETAPPPVAPGSTAAKDSDAVPPKTAVKEEPGAKPAETDASPDAVIATIAASDDDDAVAACKNFLLATDGIESSDAAPAAADADTERDAKRVKVEPQ
eukprot:m.47387 g.47387  ORF g.47387 m.47387 type:complete len:547 (-) comp15217_c0_seq1:348-1988(-)